jgi:hypothetical protein
MPTRWHFDTTVPSSNHNPVCVSAAEHCMAKLLKFQYIQDIRQHLFIFCPEAKIARLAERREEYIYISNQLDVTFIKFFYFIFATLHVSGLPCPSSGVSLLYW